MNTCRVLVVLCLMTVVPRVVTTLHLSPTPGTVQAAGQDPAQMAGTWIREKSDGNTYQKITLTLRADGTYTKVLVAQVNGASYGGTHDGTWTSQGTVVALSGDGKWPHITHDLAEFKRIE